MKAFLLLAVCLCSMSVFSQTYNSAADTIKLNKEYLNTSNDIAKLTSRLTISQNELPTLKSKAVNAHAAAKASAEESSKQAAKASNAELSELKEADKKASKALKDGYSAKSADDDIQDMEEKIVSLKEKISVKQKRLAELDRMRGVIYAAIRPAVDSTVVK